MSRRSERLAYYANTTAAERQARSRLAEVNWALRQLRDGDPKSVARLEAERGQLKATLAGPVSDVRP